MASQFAQEEKTLHPDLKVVIHDANIGTKEIVATEYNAVLAAKDCLLHLAEHAGQSLSQWKAVEGCLRFDEIAFIVGVYRNELVALGFQSAAKSFWE